jgi:hypothetical protein
MSKLKDMSEDEFQAFLRDRVMPEYLTEMNKNKIKFNEKDFYIPDDLDKTLDAETTVAIVTGKIKKPPNVPNDNTEHKQ